jgi:UDP-N-acetylmuramate--alanine ligase
MVAEADESDRSFLTLSPAVAVITNIDREHLEAYGSFEQLVDGFADFAARVPFYGAVVACADDAAVAGLLPKLTRRVIRYGFNDGADVRGFDPVSEGRTARCRVEYRLPGGPEPAGAGALSLAVPGRHNLLNALAAVAVGLELDVDFVRICDALAAFPGAERRYHVLGEARGVTVIDDYGHHPTELAAVLDAARGEHASRVIAVFQPHRYSRTREQLDAFGPALAGADLVVLTDIYPAGETPIPGITLDALAEAVRRAVPDVEVVPDIDDVPAVVARRARPGDLVLTLGAGSIGRTGPRLLAALAETEDAA